MANQEIDLNTLDDAPLLHYMRTGELPTAPTSGSAAKFNQPAHAGMSHTPDQTSYSPGSALERNAEKVLSEMPGYERALVGAGANLSNLGTGVANLGRMAATPFMPEDAAAKIRAQITAERAERGQLQAPLNRDPAAIGGGLLPYVVAGAAAPARLPAQVALESAMAGLTDPDQETTGLGGEITSRALGAALAGGTTYGVGRGVQAAGKIAGAVKGQYTPAGAKAMALRDAAERELGMNMRIADLDPNSTVGRLQRTLPGGQDDIVAQGEALRRATDATVDVPSAIGLSTQTRNIPGEGLRQEIGAAADALKQAAAAKWAALDNFVSTSGVKPIIIQNSHQAAQHASPETISLVEDYAPQGAAWLAGLRGTTMKQALQNPVAFEHVNELRMAVGKALGKAGRDFERASPSEKAMARRVREQLSSLYKSINDDMTNWGGRNAKNKEAMDLFHNANDFYRERVVPDIIGNPVVGKAQKGQVAGTNPKAFQDSKGVADAVVNRPEMVDRVMDFSSPKARALIDSLRAADDARKYMLTGDLPKTDMASMGALSGLALGHPLATLTAAASRIPGLHQMANSRAVQGYHFAKDLTKDTLAGRAAFGGAQLPAEYLREHISSPFESGD